MSRPERRAAAAREVADWLEQRGEPFRANVIRDVCRSLDTARATMAVLHRDNIALRQKGPTP